MMLLLIIGVKLSDTAPVMFFKSAKNAAWMLPLISAIIMLPTFLILLSLLEKYKNKNLIEIMHLLLGKNLGFIYGIAVASLTFTFTVITTRDVTETVITMFYPRTPPVAIYILFMSCAVFICNRGLQALGGTCLFLVPLLVVVASMAMILTIPDMRLQYIYPISGVRVTELIKRIPFYTTTTVEVILFSVLYTEVKSHAEYKKGSIFALIFGALLISSMCIAYLLVFDVVAAQQIPFPFLELTRMIRIGRFVSNAEAGFLGFWIVAAALRFSIYLFITTKLFLNSFHKNNLKPYFPFFAALCLFFGLLPENFVYLIFKFRPNLLLCGFIVIVPLPYILYFLSMRKRGGK
jgi:spore germination protein (amino acid permease)